MVSQVLSSLREPVSERASSTARRPSIRLISSTRESPLTMSRLTWRERNGKVLVGEPDEEGPAVEVGFGEGHYGSSCSARSMARRMKWETEAYRESRWTRARMRASSAAGIRKA